MVFGGFLSLNVFDIKHYTHKDRFTFLGEACRCFGSVMLYSETWQIRKYLNSTCTTPCFQKMSLCVILLSMTWDMHKSGLHRILIVSILFIYYLFIAACTRQIFKHYVSINMIALERQPCFTRTFCLSPMPSCPLTLCQAGIF